QAVVPGLLDGLVQTRQCGVKLALRQFQFGLQFAVPGPQGGLQLPILHPRQDIGGGGDLAPLQQQGGGFQQQGLALRGGGGLGLGQQGLGPGRVSGPGAGGGGGGAAGDEQA